MSVASVKEVMEMLQTCQLGKLRFQVCLVVDFSTKGKRSPSGRPMEFCPVAYLEPQTPGPNWTRRSEKQVAGSCSGSPTRIKRLPNQMLIDGLMLFGYSQLVVSPRNMTKHKLGRAQNVLNVLVIRPHSRILTMVATCTPIEGLMSMKHVVCVPTVSKSNWLPLNGRPVPFFWDYHSITSKVIPSMLNVNRSS